MRTSLPPAAIIALSTLLAAAGGCARHARLAVANTTPQRGAVIEPGSDLRIEVAYAVDWFKPGHDGIAVLLKTQGGGTWEASRQVITTPEGRITFQLAGDDLLTNAKLVRPYQLRFVLDSREGPGQTRLIKESSVVHFERALIEILPPDPEDKNARFVPPSIGKGKLLSDMVNDRRYRPRLPPVLDRPGMVVWGIFKLCVDSDGDVYSVKILKSADKLVDADWISILRTLKHRPYTIADEPVPYCYPMRLEVRSTAGSPRPRREPGR